MYVQGAVCLFVCVYVRVRGYGDIGVSEKVGGVSDVLVRAHTGPGRHTGPNAETKETTQRPALAGPTQASRDHTMLSSRNAVLGLPAPRGVGGG